MIFFVFCAVFTRYARRQRFALSLFLRDFDTLHNKSDSCTLKLRRVVVAFFSLSFGWNWRVFLLALVVLSVLCAQRFCVYIIVMPASEHKWKRKSKNFEGTQKIIFTLWYSEYVCFRLSLSFYLPLLLLPSVTCVTASSESSFLDICYLCSVCSCCVCSYAIAPRVYRFSFFGLRFRFTWFLDTFRYARNVQSLLTQKQNKIDFVCVFFSLFCFRQFSVLQLLVILN